MNSQIQPQPAIPSYNMLPLFKTSKILILLSFIILIMIICLFMIIYNVNIPSNFPTMDKSNKQVTYNVLIIIFVLLLVIAISVYLLPDTYKLLDFFLQIKWVFIIMFFTIALILFFRLTPLDTVNKYANIILIVLGVLGFILFYKGVSTNYTAEFNVNYERIKSLLLLFFFIIIVILLYSFNPGGYITKYFGPLLIFTILLVVFGLMYCILLLMVPSKIGVGATNFLSNFTNFSFYNSLFFLIFIIAITIILSTYPGGFFKKDDTQVLPIMTLVIGIVVLWVTIIGANLYDGPSTTIDSWKKSLLFLFGMIISVLFIFWIVYSVQHLTGGTSITRFILNLLIVLIVLTLIYRTMNVQIPDNNVNSKKNAFFDLITNLIFYIPCLFSGAIDYISRSGVQTGGPSYFTREKSSFMALFAAILLILLYIFGPFLYNKLNLQGGELLVNKPVNTNKEHLLGTYEDLNGSDTFDYQYAISAWIYINSNAPNTSDAYNKYTSILNFGGKPNVLYNGKTNSLMVTMEQKDLQKTTSNKLTEFDDNGNRIMYINHNVLLQKWNNIIINYSGGVLDIFLNGELVKSDIGVVPYYTLDNLKVGEDNGINGGICNVVYFNKALTALNIYFLYNMIKNKKLPVTKDSNITIMKKNLNTTTSSYEEEYSDLF
jgi:hypothetical protein